MKISNYTRYNSGTFCCKHGNNININKILIEITKQAHLISNRKYLNKAIKNEEVTIIQHVFLMSEKNLILTGFYFLNYEIHLEAIMFFEKLVIN